MFVNISVCLFACFSICLFSHLCQAGCPPVPNLPQPPTPRHCFIATVQKSNNMTCPAPFSIPFIPSSTSSFRPSAYAFSTPLEAAEGQQHQSEVQIKRERARESLPTTTTGTHTTPCPPYLSHSIWPLFDLFLPASLLHFIYYFPLKRLRNTDDVPPMIFAWFSYEGSLRHTPSRPFAPFQLLPCCTVYYDFIPTLFCLSHFVLLYLGFRLDLLVEGTVVFGLPSFSSEILSFLSLGFWNTVVPS